MIKIFGYECRRLLCGKAFLGLAAVTIWYALQTLRSTIIWGISDTAPFSPWSFGLYLATLLPFVCAAGLLLMIGFYTKSAQQTAALTQATPTRPLPYALARCAAVVLGLLLLSVCVAGMGIVFLVRLFGEVPMQGYGQVALLTLLPLPVAALGLGSVLGQRHVAALYALAALLLLLPFLPASLDPTGLSFFQSQPLTMGILDPPLQIPASMWLSRLAMLLVGIGLLGAGAKRRSRR